MMLIIKLFFLEKKCDRNQRPRIQILLLHKISAVMFELTQQLIKEAIKLVTKHKQNKLRVLQSNSCNLTAVVHWEVLNPVFGIILQY